MKKIDTNKSREELTVLLTELQAKLAKLQFDLAAKKVKNTSEIGMVKRDIARILTAFNK